MLKFVEFEATGREINKKIFVKYSHNALRDMHYDMQNGTGCQRPARQVL